MQLPCPLHADGADPRTEKQIGISQELPLYCPIGQEHVWGEIQLPLPEQTIGSFAAKTPQTGMEQLIPAHDDVLHEHTLGETQTPLPLQLFIFSHCATLQFDNVQPGSHKHVFGPVQEP